MNSTSWKKLFALFVTCVTLASFALAADKSEKKAGKKTESKSAAADANSTAEAKTDDVDDDSPAPEESPETLELTKLSTAFRLADLGRETKAPEILIAAARLLREIKPAVLEAGEIEITDADGKTVAAEKADAPKSLLDDAESLLAEARAIAKELVAAKKMTDQEATAIEALAKRVDDMPSLRGARGGSHCYWGKLAPGHTATYRIKFVSRSHCRVVANAANARLKLEVKNKGGKRLAVDHGNPAHVSFVPHTKDPNQDLRIRVTNNSRFPTTFRVFTN